MGGQVLIMSTFHRAHLLSRFKRDSSPITPLLLVVLVPLGIFLLWFWSSQCDSRHLLRLLLRDAQTVFTAHKVVIWLDYGTLLGAMREKDIIMHENDNDMGIMEGDCDGLGHEFYTAMEQKGLHVYNRSVVVPYKQHVVWDHQTHSLGYSDSHIHMPCLRIFDWEFTFYIDVYSYREVSVEEANQLQHKGKILLPTSYPREGGDQHPLVCNAEGLKPEEFYAGGCRRKDMMFPLRPLELCSSDTSEFCGATYLVPHKAIQLVREMYPESDAMAVSTPKGPKRVLCSASNSLLAYLGLVGLASLALSCFRACRAKSC